EPVVADHRPVAVSTPNTVVIPHHHVPHDAIAAEGDLDPVRRRVTEIIPVNQIVVAAPLPRIHRALPRPQEQAIPTVGHGIPGDDVPGALLEEQQSRGVLAPVIELRIATDVVIEPIVLDVVLTRAIQPDAEPGIERKVVVPDAQVIGPGEHEPVHAALTRHTLDVSGVHTFEINPRPIPEPLA